MPDVELTARQPLALGTRPASSAPVPTHLHVPGSTLRGALAAAWIAEHGQPRDLDATEREAFLDLFERRVHYGPLLAPGSAVVPLSVLRCTYRTTDACHTAVYDQAFDQGRDGTCPYCPGRLKAGRGDVEFFGGHGRVTADTVHREIDNTTGRAATSQPFTRRALWHRGADGTARTFTGRITLPDTLPGDLGEWLTRARMLRVGGRRRTSGAVDYRTLPDGPPPPEAAGAQAAAGVGAEAGGTRLAVRLTAPAILVDHAGLPVDPADRATLREVLTDEIATTLGVDIHDIPAVWCRRERVGGWHAASNLPKPDDLAFSAGTVFLLDLDHAPSTSRLHALLDRGLGLRRGEGFGALTVGTGPWQPPHPLPEHPTTGEGTVTGDTPVDEAETHARFLYDTRMGAWLCDKLRDYAADRSRGTQPHLQLMRRSRVALLTPEQNRRLRELLLHTDVPTLDRTLVLLDARLRKGRQ